MVYLAEELFYRLERGLLLYSPSISEYHAGKLNSTGVVPIWSGAFAYES
jgi:hypothetical protein